MPAKIRAGDLMKVQANLNARIRAIGGASRQALVEVGLDLLGSAADAPVDLGDLRAAHTLQVNGVEVARANSDGAVTDSATAPAEPSDGHTVIRVGTSGIPYAVRQHEEIGYNHPKGGKAKWLEDRLNERTDRYVAHIEQAAKKGARGET